jgi:simple sugar transport system substrate-binding protein
MRMSDSDKQPLRFAFITPCVGEAFFDPVKRGVQDAARMLGVHCTFDGTADVDLVEQEAMIRRALDEGYDGLALSIPHPSALNSVIAAALDGGTLVVAFNVDATEGLGGRLTAVRQDCYRAGRTFGQEVAARLPAGSRVLMTVHSEGISALDDRVRGAQEVLGPQGVRCHMLTTGIEAEGAARVIGDALRSDPQISAVLCSGQADSEGAGLAKERSFADRELLAAGYDLSPTILRLVRHKVMAFTIDQQPYMQGFYPVVQLALWRRYGIRPSNIDAGAALISADNVDQVLAGSAAGYR